jgi:hypothetical protein
MENNILIKGKFKIKTYNKGILIRETDWIENLVMAGANNGLGVITKRMIGDFANDIEITTAEIGSGTTAPALSDTNLETPVVTGILRANQSSTPSVVTLEFFIASDGLSNGNYAEFGLRAGTQLFTRALIDPIYTKSANEDTSIEYSISLTNQ